MTEESNDKNILTRLVDGAGAAADSKKHDTLMEKVGELKESEKKLETKSEAVIMKKAIGLDIGTSRIVSLKSAASGEAVCEDQLNAFITVPESTFVKEMLKKNQMNHTKIRDDIAVLGYDAQKFANTLNSEIRRPMKKGLLKPDESNAIPAIKEIIKLVIPRAEEVGGKLCFSIPAPEVGFETDLVFHEGILKKYLVGMGYNAKSITEGTAIVLSELSNDNYTGIGISMGAGMCNVCFSFLSIPVIVFSIPKGGDDIDFSVARVTNETMNRVRVIKEESLDFATTPKNNMENAFHIYYEDLIMTLLNNLAAILSQTENLPMLSQAIPIVIAGGTSLPNGFKSKFDRILRQIKLPIEISEVRIAAAPLRSTARGALINASV